MKSIINGFLKVKVYFDFVPGTTHTYFFQTISLLIERPFIGCLQILKSGKKRLWKKGETSGNELLVKNILTDCDSDTILIFARPKGPTCHKGNISCFDNDTNAGFIYLLESIIDEKKMKLVKNHIQSFYLKKVQNILQERLARKP